MEKTKVLQRFRCPLCSGRMLAFPAHSGHHCTCKHCKQRIRIPWLFDSPELFSEEPVAKVSHQTRSFLIGFVATLLGGGVLGLLYLGLHHDERLGRGAIAASQQQTTWAIIFATLAISCSVLGGLFFFRRK